MRCHCLSSNLPVKSEQVRLENPENPDNTGEADGANPAGAQMIQCEMMWRMVESS